MIYLDYASATPVDPRVQRAMTPYFAEKFGNAMSLHALGREASSALEQSRSAIAGVIGVKSNEIIFTGSATESNNLALKGVALARKSGRIIISSIEHESVLEPAQWLQKRGFKITRLKVDEKGFVDLQELKSAATKDTILVSVIHASNEIGTIQPIKEIAQILKIKNRQLKTKVYFHTDAAQSFGKVPIDVNKMGVDLLTASSHKIYGPKGAAFLYVRQGTKIEPLLHGGDHERGLRSSTVNVPAIVGFAKAAEICQKEMKQEGYCLIWLSNKLIKGILQKIPEARFNGPKEKRLPGIVNFSFEGVSGEELVFKLDLMGLGVSTGSACALSKTKPSHVLLALGLSQKDARSSVRFSLGRFTNKEDIDYVLKVLPKAIKELRKKL